LGISRVGGGLLWALLDYVKGNATLAPAAHGLSDLSGTANDETLTFADCRGQAAFRDLTR